MFKFVTCSLSMIIICLIGGGATQSSWAREFSVPCPQEFPVIYTLAKRLDQAENPRVWASIYRETQETLQLLHTQRDTGSRSDNSHHANDTQTACAHAIALESALYLSDDRLKGRLWAMRSVAHAVSLSSLRMDVLQTRRGRQ